MRSLQALKTRKTSKAYLQEFALAGDSGALPSPEAWLSRLFFILSQHLIFLSLQRAELTFSVLPLAQVITPERARAVLGCLRGRLEARVPGRTLRK